jgi:hypothetical protein
MHTRIGLLISETCMTIAAAKPPGLIITSLILAHPILTGIACQLHTMPKSRVRAVTLMAANGSLCSLYACGHKIS